MKAKKDKYKKNNLSAGRQKNLKVRTKTIKKNKLKTTKKVVKRRVSVKKVTPAFGFVKFIEREEKLLEQEFFTPAFGFNKHNSKSSKSLYFIDSLFINNKAHNLNKILRHKRTKTILQISKVTAVYLAIIYMSVGNFAPVYAQALGQAVDNLVSQASSSALFAPRVALPIPQLIKPFVGDHPVSRIYGDTDLDHQDSAFGRALSIAEGPKGNNGLDFSMPLGTPLVAVDDGTIIQAGSGDYGTTVVIKNSWGKSLYGHLSEIGNYNVTNGGNTNDNRKLQPGDQVKKGDIIGWAGQTGLATGPHLHFGLKDSNDNWVDPANYLGLPQFAAKDPNATGSATLASLGSQVLGIETNNLEASLSATSRRPSAFDDKLNDSSEHFRYRKILNRGVNAHFWDKDKKKADFSLTDDSGKSSLSFTLRQDSNATDSAAPTVNGEELTYPVTVGGVDAVLKYTVTDNQVKEQIVFDKKPDISNDLNIVFDTQVNGLKTTSNNGQYNLKSDDGSDNWTIQTPNVVDSKGDNGQIIGVLDGSTYTLKIDKDFLDKANYPITVDPTVVINTSSDLNATQASTQHHIVRTSDGTLHSFVQVGTQTATCGGSSKSGLLWFNSTDNGATWTCQAQLSSDTTNLFYADARVDTSDNIYVVYSVNTTGRNNAYDVIYQKISYNGSSSWTAQTPQTVLDGSGSATAYSYATIELESTTRAWIATRYYDGTNYGVTVQYSNSLGNAPTWTQSISNLDTVGSTNTKHIPTMIRFGTSIGVIWSDQTANGLYWRTRGDSDSLSSWTAQVAVFTATGLVTPTFAAATDNQGHIYVATNAATSVYLNYFNGATWTAALTVSSAAASAAFVSLSTDGDNVWVFYGDTTNLAAGLSGNRRLVYKECYPPFLVTADCDTNSTSVNSYQDIFDKSWAFRATGSVYTDVTTAAGNTTTADVFNSSSTKMVSALGDIIYFGKTVQYDAISWAISTAGVGGTIVWEYCSGVDGSNNCNAWSTLSFTASSTPSFTATTNGYGAFTPPGGWVAGKVNTDSSTYYYIRARVSVAYTTAPIGTQMTSIPQINWPSAITNVVSNSVYMTWNENATSPEKVKYGAATVSALTPGTDSNINPVSAYSSLTTASQLSTQHHLVRTTDGTLHQFIQAGTLYACGAGSGTAPGLVWLTSTDSGATWNCQGQLNSAATYFADARVDSSDNIYVVYSTAANGAGAANDVFYRKLTYGGSSWTLGSEQTVFDGTGSVGYSYAALEIDSSRVWVAARYFDGVNYQVSVDYSNDQSASPTWTTSITNLETVGSTTTKHIPTMVRFGTNIGVIWVDQTSTGLYWRFHGDSDPLTSWTGQAPAFSTTALTTATFTAVSDSQGHIYLAAVPGTNAVYLTYFNGETWTTPFIVSSTVTAGTFVALSTDGNSVWVFYGDTTNLSGSLPGLRRLAYKKCSPPFFTATDCDSTATNVNTYQDIFDKVWKFTSIGSVYADETTAAGNTTTADVSIGGALNDIMYWGKTTPFDTLGYVLSTNGTTGVVRWEYWNGTAWVPIPTFISTSAQNYTATGYINFVPMSDWATTQINGESTPYYYIRSRVVTAYVAVPIGTQMDAIPQINWANSLTNVVSNTTPIIWTENSVSPMRLRYKTVTTTSSTRSAASEISPSVVGYSALTTATQDSSQHHLVRTTDGTLHAFVQSSTTQLGCGGQAGNNSASLNWIESTDNGATWSCQGQLNSAATYFADARVDSSDNIYVTYSVAGNGAGAANDVYYRKITYNGSSTWTLGAERLVLDGTAGVGYAYAALELDPSHVWISARYFDGTNYQVTVYYSSNLSDNPSWTQSITHLDTVGTTATRHTPAMVRFGTNIGVVWNDQTNTGLRWRFRNDSDDLSAWVTETNVFSTAALGIGLFAVTSDSAGRVYVAADPNTTAYLTYFNGVAWTAPLVVTTTSSSALFISLSTDGNNVWVFYGDTTNLSGTLSGNRRLAYKKCAPPFLNTTDCDTSPTNIVSTENTYDKVWLYNQSAAAYQDLTTAAANTTAADVFDTVSSGLVSAVSDAAYFGSASKFDTISWVLSTNGTTGTVVWEYWNGSAWAPLTDILTYSSASFTGSGNLTFIPDNDWAATQVSTDSSPYYYIRARVTSAYVSKPVGTQMAAISAVNWASALSNVVSDTTPIIWTENAAAPERVRYIAATTTSSSRSTVSEIAPGIIGYSATVNGTAASMERHLVRASNGTLNAFVEANTQLGCGSQTGTNIGLMWVQSTNGGATWSCMGALNTSTLYYSDAQIDSSNNIYLVYSAVGASAGTQYDVFYRKLTYSGANSWTLGAEQIAIDNVSSSQHYEFATIAVEGTSRLWIATRYFDGTNYKIPVYYSSDQSDTPTWTQSVAAVDTPGTNGSYHVGEIVRFGTSKTAVIFTDQASGGDMKWSWRDDSDGLTSWNAIATANASTALATSGFSVAGDTNGNIYIAVNQAASIFFNYYNGSGWSSNTTVTSTAASSTFVSVSTDGTSAWVLYGDTNGLSGSLFGSRRLVYQKGVAPFAFANFGAVTPVISQETTYDKVWLYNQAATGYQDLTTAAGNTTTADVKYTTTSAVVSAVNDAAYFGATTKFDSISWALSTAGTTGVIEWEYWNGSSWTPLTDIISSATPNFTATTGYISFIPNNDWAATQVNTDSTPYYYIRARVVTAFGTKPVGTQMDAMTQINMANLIGTTDGGVYGIWTENSSAVMKMRYSTIFEPNNGPTLAQLLRHGQWFNNGVIQPFTW
ncbi:MAG TPA: peptidoglycan DD-metalloendopeptidase family protein [Patescibacteria group bacterium]|nr:peptidoglycan DD-metalloendopeptidase family protein [Patescibacteria group bacterium]